MRSCLTYTPYRVEFCSNVMITLPRGIKQIKQAFHNNVVLQATAETGGQSGSIVSLVA